MVTLWASELIPCIFCMVGVFKNQKTYQFTQGCNILHTTFIIHTKYISTLYYIHTYIYELLKSTLLMIMLFIKMIQLGNIIRYRYKLGTYKKE